MEESANTKGRGYYDKRNEAIPNGTASQGNICVHILGRQGQ